MNRQDDKDTMNRQDDKEIINKQDNWLFLKLLLVALALTSLIVVPVIGLALTICD